MKKLDIFAVGFGGVLVGVIVGGNLVFGRIYLAVALAVLYLVLVSVWVWYDGGH